MRLNIYTNDGYIALISAIVISILLIAITFTLSFTGFYSRFNVLDSENKKISSALAEACVNSAMVKLANDKDYVLIATDHAIPVGGNTCNIVEIKLPRTNPVTIHAQGIHNRSYTDLEVEVNVSLTNVTVNSWKELAHF